MKTTWEEGLKKPAFKKLDKDCEVDVAIIGGGMAGMLTAYNLVKAGKKVAVFEKDQIGNGATIMTTAFLTQDIDTDPSDLVSMFGPQKAGMVWSSHKRAIDALEEIASSEKIECEFMRANVYTYAKDKKELEGLKDEAKEIKKLGYKAEVKVNNEFPFENAGALVLNNQGKFHPAKFLFGVAQAILENGGQIFEGSEALEISPDGQNITFKNRHKVSAKKTMVATYYPFNNPKPTHYKKGMYVSYVMEVQVPTGRFEEAMFMDMANPYHYFRIDRGDEFDRMIVGGEDHRKEIPISEKKNFKALEEYLREIMGKEKYEITKKWYGPILEPSDGLPLIGEYAPNQYVAAAFSGNGMTYSAITGILISDLILTGESKWKDVYDPKRVPTVKQLYKKGKDYAGELLGGAIKNSIK